MTFLSVADALHADTVVLICGVLLTIKVVSSLLSAPLRRLPGPWYTTFTNLPLKLSVISGRRVYFIHNLHKRYGPIVRISPNEVAICDLSNVQKIHKVGSGFYKTDWYIKLTSAPRDGIFVMRDPRDHAMRRRLFARAFSKTSLRSQWEETVQTKAKLAVRGINDEIERTGEADLLKWWTFLATDVIGHLSFGESFRMLESGQKNDYIAMLEKALMGGGIAAELPVVASILKRFPFKVTQQLFNTNELLAKYAEKAVRNARRDDSKGNIFSSIIAEAENGAGTIDNDDVQYEAGNLIVAGSDTTAVTLTYVTWSIIQRPELRKALVEEVRALPDSFTDADLEALALLNATIEEALRLYGAAPGSLPRSVPSGGATFGD